MMKCLGTISIFTVLNEKTLGELILFFEMQTPMLGELYSFDTFNQSRVEIGKQITRGKIKKDIGFIDDLEIYSK